MSTDAQTDPVERLAVLGRALADPIRIRMLRLMAAGRRCCDLPQLGVPVDGDEDGDGPGICVCEFTAYFDIGQSKVSYHLGKLKEAGLVREERRGKWSFYSVDEVAVRRLLPLLADVLAPSVPGATTNGTSGSCCECTPTVVRA